MGNGCTKIKKVLQTVCGFDRGTWSLKTKNGLQNQESIPFSKSCPVMETSVIVFTIYTKYGIIFATGILSFFSFLPRFGCFQIIYMLEIIGAVAGK